MLTVRMAKDFWTPLPKAPATPEARSALGTAPVVEPGGKGARI